MHHLSASTSFDIRQCQFARLLAEIEFHFWIDAIEFHIVEMTVNYHGSFHKSEHDGQH
jgi:hypothetical protein